MKPAKVGMTANTALASWQPSGGANSQIPLPLRRGSNKSEKGTESDAPDSGESASKDRQRRSHPERSTLKSSILGSSSFCCASGQKEDYERLPSARPAKKKVSKNVPQKRDPEKTGSDSPAANGSKRTHPPRNRPAKVDNDSTEEKCNKDCTKPPVSDGPPPTKPRGLTHPAPPIHERKPSPRINNHSGKFQDGKKPTPELSRNDTRASSETEPNSGRQKYTEVIRKLRKDPPECTSNNLASLNVQNDKLYEKAVTGQNVATEEAKCDPMVKSCGTEELDCPCCDSESDNNLVKSVAENCASSTLCHDGSSEISSHAPIDCRKCSCKDYDDTTSIVDKEVTKEGTLELEMKALQEELATERILVRKQQLHILELEKEVQVMEQLKEELIKEKELRTDAEQKLIEALAKDKPMTAEEYKIKLKNAIPTEDMATITSNTEGNSSPLFLGYESRIRRYQSYISKLEKDNVMLVSELKKFQDLSPCSREEQAKFLLVKLDQLERDNHQQQKEYESCLDEVANKLVHTLLIQKRLEEECKVLHLRVEQLEMENTELLKIIKTNEKNEENNVQVQHSSAVFPKDRISSASNPSTPTQIEVERDTIFSRSVEETNSELQSKPTTLDLNISSPEHKPSNGNESPGDKSNINSSKIPAFNNNNNNSKISPNRKRSKPESASNVQENNKSTRLSHSDTTPIQDGVPTVKKIPSPSRITSTESTVHPRVKQKLPTPLSSPTKLPSVKRKRSTKANQSEKPSKDSKLRSTTKHPQWNAESSQKVEVSPSKKNNLPQTPIVQQVNGVLPSETAPMVQEVWSFNCTIENNTTDQVISEVMNSTKWKLDSNGIPESTASRKFEEAQEIVDKLSPSLGETENSVTVDGVHRSKDEGYSTMSSDLQPDSVTDTLVSEHEEPSTTFLAAGSRFVSDDSVTECLDGSMTSSSDSGFGPLQQIGISSHPRLTENAVQSHKSSVTLTSSTNNTVISTASTYLNDYSLKDFEDITPTKPPDKNAFCGIYTQPNLADNISSQPSIIHNTTLLRNDNNNSPSRTLVTEKENYFTEAVFNINNIGVQDCNTSNRYSQTSFGSSEDRKSVIECTMNDLEVTNRIKDSENRMVETAEKATWTEPEEEMWREKTLSHFIDESIWSLYSSESDTQLRYFSADLGAEVSPLEGVDSSCPHSTLSPNIVITGPEESPDSPLCIANVTNIESTQAQTSSDFTALLLSKSGVQDLGNIGRDFGGCGRKVTLERVASDSILYQKDAVHELEDALKPGLKTTRHFTSSKHDFQLFPHYSLSDICNVDISPLIPNNNVISPEILLNLEKTMLQNNYIWPSSANASRSSSLCSVQSSNSCHVISDETDDVDNMRQPSRKGSQDPDLSSASDAEYENLEHKDFVERWIQKEITQKVELNIQKPDGNEKPDNKRMPLSVRKKSGRPFLSPRKDAVFLNNHKSRSWAKCSLSEKNTPEELNKATDSGGKSSYLIPTGNFITNAAFSCPPDDATSLTSSSSIVYPIIFTCENIDDDIEPCSNMHEIEADLQLLDSDLKEFNDDFYRLCDVGTSSLSLDRSHLPIILERFDHLEASSSPCPGSPAIARNQIPINQKLSFPPEATNIPRRHSNSATAYKPTGLVKPMRPVTLTFCDAGNALGFYRFQKKDLGEKIVEAEVSKPSDTPKSSDSNSKTFSNDVKGTTKDDDILVYHKNSVSSSKTIEDAQEDVAKSTSSNSKPCPETHTSCSYTSTKTSLPTNQNVVRCAVAKPRSKSNMFRGDSIVYATENPKLVPVRKCYNKLKNSTGSPEKSYRSGVQSQKDTSMANKRCQWRKDRRPPNSKEGCGTAWIHLQTNPSLLDPKARASFLDSMAETVSSSESSSDDDDDLLFVQSNSHLQRICREKRQRIKASRGEDFIGISPRHRSSVINRQSLYFRFGDQEKAAISCFDFLEEIPTSASEPGSLETFSSKRLSPPGDLNTSGKKQELFSKERINLVSPCASEIKSKQCSGTSFGTRFRVPVLWNQPISHNMSSSTLNSQDCEILDHVSLSDSCAESYSSTPDSFEDVS